MSEHNKHEFDPNCHGCQPAMLDMQTRRPLPDDHPMVVTARAVWMASSYEEQKAWHDVTVNNSRAPRHLELAQRLVGKIEAALKERQS